MIVSWGRIGIVCGDRVWLGGPSGCVGEKTSDIVERVDASTSRRILLILHWVTHRLCDIKIEYVSKII